MTEHRQQQRTKQTKTKTKPNQLPAQAQVQSVACCTLHVARSNTNAIYDWLQVATAREYRTKRGRGG